MDLRVNIQPLISKHNKYHRQDVENQQDVLPDNEGVPAELHCGGQSCQDARPRQLPGAAGPGPNRILKKADGNFPCGPRVSLGGSRPGPPPDHAPQQAMGDKRRVQTPS